MCLWYASVQAWRIYRSLDVSYVFVVFGGIIGYPSDDINKFLWMVSESLFMPALIHRACVIEWMVSERLVSRYTYVQFPVRAERG